MTDPHPTPVALVAPGVALSGGDRRRSGRAARRCGGRDQSAAGCGGRSPGPGRPPLKPLEISTGAVSNLLQADPRGGPPPVRARLPRDRAQRRREMARQRLDPAGMTFSGAREACFLLMGAIFEDGCPIDERATDHQHVRRRRPRPTSPAAAPPVEPLEPGAAPLAILVDYDGTIALTDVSDTVMAEHTNAAWEAMAARYDRGEIGSRGLMEYEMSLIRADGVRPPGDRGAPAARPGLRAIRPASAGGRRPGRGRQRRVRILHRPGARAARGAGAAGHHGPDHVRRRPGEDRLPERPSELLRVRHVQAAAGARPPGGRPGGRLHRRRRERSLCRRLRRRRVRQARPRPDLRRQRLAVPALDRVRRDPRLARRSADRLASRPGRRRSCRARSRKPFFCGPEVWGEGRWDPPAE